MFIVIIIFLSIFTQGKTAFDNLKLTVKDEFKKDYIFNMDFLV